MLLVSTTRIIPGRAVPSFLTWTLFRCQSAQEIVRYRGVHADATMDRIVHGTAWVEMGELNMRRRLGSGSG